MNYRATMVMVVFLAAVLLGCALLLRDGLRSVAREIRDKPWPQVPETVHIREVTVGQATLAAGASATNGTNQVKITIENMKVDAQLPQPQAK